MATPPPRSAETVARLRSGTFVAQAMEPPKNDLAKWVEGSPPLCFPLFSGFICSRVPSPVTWKLPGLLQGLGAIYRGLLAASMLA